jgi:hypothetical protein
MAEKTRILDPKRLILVLVMTAISLFLLFFNDLARRVFMQEQLNGRGMILVDKALEDNWRAFLTVSAIKGVVAMVEGSTVGVGFSLEVGDLVQPAHDYIDFVWRVFLWALTILFVYKLTLETGVSGAGFYLAGAGLMIMAGAIIWEGRRRALFSWGARALFIGLFVAYVIPVALIGSNALGQKYTQPVKTKQQERMDRARREYDQAKMDLLNLKEAVSITSPGASMDNVRNALMAMAHTTARLTREGSSAFLYYVLVVMFELLVLPFFTGLILYFGFKMILERTLPPRVETGADGRNRDGRMSEPSPSVPEPV